MVWIAPVFDIHHWSRFLLLANLGEHHSMIVNYIFLTECSFPVECLETGVILLSLGNRELVFIDSSKMSAFFTYKILTTFCACVRYIISLNSHNIILGKSIMLYCLPLILHVILSTLLICWQYVHLFNLLH